MKSVELTKENIAGYDLIILETDHQDYDYKFISENEKSLTGLVFTVLYNASRNWRRIPMKEAEFKVTPKHQKAYES